jgi:hypothetical protein
VARGVQLAPPLPQFHKIRFEFYTEGDILFNGKIPVLKRFLPHVGEPQETRLNSSEFDGA